MDRLKEYGKLIAPVANEQGIGNMQMIERSHDKMRSYDLTSGRVDTVSDSSEPIAHVHKEIPKSDNYCLNDIEMEGPYSRRVTKRDDSYLFLKTGLVDYDYT